MTGWPTSCSWSPAQRPPGRPSRSRRARWDWGQSWARPTPRMLAVCVPLDPQDLQDLQEAAASEARREPWDESDLQAFPG